jgi:peptide/nickel transport system permease protein
VFGIIVLNFLLLNLLPSDAVDAMAAQSGSATAETMQALRVQLGLDQNVLTQLITYMANLLTLNFGYSLHYSAPVFDIILSRLPNTMLLLFSALAIAYVLGLLAGWVMAVFAGRWPDRVLTAIVLVLYSAPGFWLGLMAIVLFSARLGWLPSGGNTTIGADLSGTALLADRAKYLVLPAFAMATNFIAIYARLTRASMLDLLQQDFMRAAAAKGLHPVVLQLRHGMRNALIPVTTVAGLHLANLLSGAVVVETVYGWPGLGLITLDAVMARDFNVLLGIMLMSSVMVIVTNMVIDLVIAWLDPRIALG